MGHFSLAPQLDVRVDMSLGFDSVLASSLSTFAKNESRAFALPCATRLWVHQGCMHVLSALRFSDNDVNFASLWGVSTTSAQENEP